MRRLLLMMSVSFLLLIAAACGSKEEVNGSGEGPADIPVQWANAEVQMDQAKRLELLEEKTKALDPKHGPENNKAIEQYKLTEWKVSDSNYFYEITYQHPIEDRLKTERMEVIKTDSGWKRTKYGEIYNFEKLVEDLELKVLKELHDK